MSHFVLVHGAWHGAWCWHKVVARLEARGHTVLAPDLPGHGIDQTPRGSVTLDDYATRVCETLGRCAEPAILVGHSMGGMVVSQAAERRPDRVRRLVYLAAFLPADGRSLFDESASMSESLVAPNIEAREEEGVALFSTARLREAFYADCSDDDIALARALLVPQALAPLATPVSLTEQAFGGVDRAYIEAGEDRAITLDAQRRMQQTWPCSSVHTLASSHSPFFSCPDELSGLLHDLGSG
jgi:pimeloyl-ACP methyl ester carboxylesterase